MFNFSRNRKKGNSIKIWANKVCTLINENEALKAKIDQLGILNGNTHQWVPIKMIRHDS